MVYRATVYEVLIASPGDVKKERDEIPKIIHQWNALHSKEKNVILMPIKWETHSVPEAGNRPQEIINEQIVKKADILIGIFWTRFGTNTGIAESGTVEEIEQFIDSNRVTMIYFSNKPIHPDKIDNNEHTKVQNFKTKYGSKNLYSTYKTLDELKGNLYNHLTRTVDRLNKENSILTLEDSPLEADNDSNKKKTLNSNLDINASHKTDNILLPKEKMLLFLENTEKWVNNGNNILYYDLYPEYTIEFSEADRFKEPYTFFYTCETGLLGTAYFKYHQTVLFTLEYMYLDEARSNTMFSVPETKYIRTNNKENWFYYYDLSNLNGKFLHFLTKGTFNFSGRYQGEEAPFLIFKNTQELNDFTEYLIKNEGELDKIEINSRAKFANERMKNMNYKVDSIFLSKAEEVYKIWKNIHKNNLNKSIGNSAVYISGNHTSRSEGDAIGMNLNIGSQSNNKVIIDENYKSFAESKNNAIGTNINL